MPVVKHGEIVIANEVRIGVWGAVAENIDNYDLFPHLLEVASVVDFDRFWSWYTRWQLDEHFSALQ